MSQFNVEELRVDIKNKIKSAEERYDFFKDRKSVLSQKEAGFYLGKLKAFNYVLRQLNLESEA